MLLTTGNRRARTPVLPPCPTHRWGPSRHSGCLSYWAEGWMDPIGSIPGRRWMQGGRPGYAGVMQSHPCAIPIPCACPRQLRSPGWAFWGCWVPSIPPPCTSGIARCCRLGSIGIRSKQMGSSCEQQHEERAAGGERGWSLGAPTALHRPPASPAEPELPREMGRLWDERRPRQGWDAAAVNQLLSSNKMDISHMK